MGNSFPLRQLLLTEPKETSAPYTAPTQRERESETNDAKEMMMTRTRTTTIVARRVALLALLALAVIPAPSLQQSGGAPNNYNIGEDKCISEDNQDFLLDVAKKSEDFSTLVAALESVPELLPIFQNKKDKLTVLAPTNEAFANFLGDFNSTPEKFLEDKDLTKLVLSYHVIPSVVPYSDMEMALKPLFMSQVGVTTSVPGDELSLTRVKPEGQDDYVIRSAGYASAAYLSPDSVWACNGVINPINYVLVPRQATVTKPELRIGSAPKKEAEEKEGED